MADYIWSPSYVVVEEISFDNIKTEFENTSVQVRQRWPGGKRIFRLIHNNLDKTICDAIRDFFISKAGSLDTFTFEYDSVEYTVRFLNDVFISELSDLGVYNIKVDLEERK